MGANLSKALAKLFGNKEMRLLMLGLDAAGKTSEFCLDEYKNRHSFVSSNPVQAQTQPERNNNPNRRIQRRDSNIQKRQV
ncbi:hypothetical protein FRC12_013230 [Ceratobasidium sp. 428]|nr:hypothetical protein FRC12_013230 [Ceratobasidium sp. 428]